MIGWPVAVACAVAWRFGQLAATADVSAAQADPQVQPGIPLFRQSSHPSTELGKLEDRDLIEVEQSGIAAQSCQPPQPGIGAAGPARPSAPTRPE